MMMTVQCIEYLHITIFDFTGFRFKEGLDWSRDT